MSGISQTLRSFRNIWGQGDDEYDDDEQDPGGAATPPPSTQRPYSSGNASSQASPGYHNNSYAGYNSQSAPSPSYGGGGGAAAGVRRLRPVPSPLRSAREKNIYTLKPKSQEDAATAADSLKSGVAVIINLEEVDRLNAVRIIDFMSGVCYALEGHAMKLGDTIFLYTPPDFDISSDETDYAENPDFFFKDVAAQGAPQNATVQNPAPQVTSAQVFTTQGPPQSGAIPSSNQAPPANSYDASGRRSWER